MRVLQIKPVWGLLLAKRIALGKGEETVKKQLHGC
jgi:hypothetical protein